VGDYTRPFCPTLSEDGQAKLMSLARARLSSFARGLHLASH